MIDCIASAPGVVHHSADPLLGKRGPPGVGVLIQCRPSLLGKRQPARRIAGPLSQL